MDREKFFKFCFGCFPSDFSETVILTPFIPLKYFEKYGDPISDFKGKLYSGGTILAGGKKITVINCGVGLQLAGDAILLLEETPAQIIIFTGSCGGLKDSRIGDLIVCENAFDGEGFSRYCTRDFTMKDIFEKGNLISADPKLTGKLKSFAAGSSEDSAFLKFGDVFTIGSLVAEDHEILSDIEEKGFRGIDLELSAVYNAARSIGIRAVGLVFASDLPGKKPLGEELTIQEKESCKKGLERVVRLSMKFA